MRTKASLKRPQKADGLNVEDARRERGVLAVQKIRWHGLHARVRIPTRLPRIQSLEQRHAESCRRFPLRVLPPCAELALIGRHSLRTPSGMKSFLPIACFHGGCFQHRHPAQSAREGLCTVHTTDAAR